MENDQASAAVAPDSVYIESKHDCSSPCVISSANLQRLIFDRNGFGAALRMNAVR